MAGTNVALKKEDVPTEVSKQGDAADAAIKQLAEGKPVEIEQDPHKPVQQPETPPVKEEPEKTPKDDYKHKYDVLNGIFQKKIGEKDQIIEQLTSTVQNLNDLLMKKVETAPAATPDGGAEESASIPEVSGRLDPEDFEGYGEEMTEMVNTVNSLIGQNEALKKENDALKGQVSEVGSTVEADAESRKKEKDERFTKDLTDKVPDWPLINADPRWLEYLDQPDPVSNIRRQTLLDDASRNFDVGRVALMFNQFRVETGWVAPNDVQPPSKEGQVVPDASGGSAQVPGGDAPNAVTAKEFHEASVDYTQGRITYEQYKKISDNFQRSLAKK